MKALKILLVLVLMLSLTIPAMAHTGKGPGGKGGGKDKEEEPTQEIPDTGTLYGDLYVILRDENGVPMFDENLCIQPISSVTASVTIETNGDPLTIYAFEGQPFSLAYYTDPAGDLVECELTEAMADWVQTVDFGRLNLGRAPDSVIAHAFDEAINKLNVATEIYLDPAGRLVLTLPDEENEGSYVDKTIDAPAENLALYIEMMTDGDWVTEDTTPITHGGLPSDVGPPEGDGPSAEDRPVINETAIGHLEDLGFTNLGVDKDVVNTVLAENSLNSQEVLLAASLLAAAADKTGTITLDKVVYINFIYGINQLGSLWDEIPDGRYYFDFRNITNEDGSKFSYGRSEVYSDRSSGGCADGWVQVLQPELDASNLEVPNHFVTTCMYLLGYDPNATDPVNAVRFTDMEETYITDWVYEDGAPMTDSDDEGNLVPVGATTLSQNFTTNVRGFAQAADDALQVIEYIHNYKIPEVLYP